MTAFLSKLVFGLAAAGALCLSAALADDPVADLIIHNGKLVTVDGSFSIAEAAAIRDGRFIAVGGTGEVMAYRGADTRMIDVGGRTVLPGFNDTHLHVLRRAVTFVEQVDLTEVQSIEDIQAAIRARAEDVEPGEWIFGSRGWWEYELSDGRIPTRYDLDEAAPDNPVSIPGPHYDIVNSLALELAGIDRNTPDPQGGEIRRDENGEPTGLLFDNASRPIDAFFPEVPVERQLLGLKNMIARINAYGITSYREPGGSLEGVALLRRLYDAGELNVRVDWAYNVDPNLPEDELVAKLESFGPPGQTWGDGMFRADGLAEVGLDGAELTAMLRDPYPGRPDYTGLQKVPQDQFNLLALTAARMGWRLGPHAVGDAAIDEAIEAFRYANEHHPIHLERWMIDHAFLLIPDHYDDVRELGLFINSQYMHNAQLGALILEAWERPLADQSEMFGDWVENGIIFGNGADGPVSYIANPLLYIWGSVTRGTLWGGKLGPDQGLSREDAIRSVTIWSAYSSFEEKIKGSIEPGKYADFVVLSDPILEVPAEQIKDIEVLATVLGGRTVHGSLAF